MSMLRVTTYCAFVLWFAVGACSSSTVVQAPTCTPPNCSCEEDPSQSICRGFNERPDGGVDPADARVVDSADDARD